MPGSDEELRALERRALDGDKDALERLKGLWSGRYGEPKPEPPPAPDPADQLAQQAAGALLDGPGSIPGLLARGNGLVGTMAGAVLASGAMALMRPIIERSLARAIRTKVKKRRKRSEPTSRKAGKARGRRKR